VAERILDLHGWAALALVFLLPALESSAFIGFLFPGEIAVLLGGVLAFEHRVGLPAVIAAAIAGAVVGDTIGYLVGRRYGRRILQSTVGKLVREENLTRAEQFVSRRGGRAVFLGRFTAALRVLVPGLAGMAEVDYRTFAVYNVAGAAIWATGFVLVGYAAGTSWRRVESIAKRASLVLLLVVTMVLVVVAIGRWVGQNQARIQEFASRQTARPRVAALRRRYRRELDFVLRRVRPEGALGLTLSVSLILIGAFGWVFGAVARDVTHQAGATLGDQAVFDFFIRHRTATATSAMRVATAFGGSAVLLFVVAVTGAVGWWRRRRLRTLLLMLAAWGGANVLFRLVKALVARPRPPAGFALGHFTGFSFPSGHATAAAATWCMAAALAATIAPTWSRKIAGWTAAVLIAALVGVSRLYLGAHWLTDVVGGAVLGIVWILVVLGVVRTVDELRNRA